MTREKTAAGVIIRLALWVWFIAALAAGQFGLLAHRPPATVPALVLALTAAVVLFYRRVAAVRDAAATVDLRVLVALHLTRFVGLYFLLLYARGILPYAFAVPGGIGDIVVATSALALILIPLPPAIRLRAFAIWNTVGLVELVLVVLTAARLNLAQPGSMHALTQLPLSLLPTFLVPLLLATHLLLYARLRAAAPEHG